MTLLESIKSITRPRSEWFPWQHLVLLLSAIYALTLPVSWGWWIASLVLWFLIISIGINFTFHRLLSHKAFKTYKSVEVVGSLLGILANTGSPLAWVMMHRQHHFHTDVEWDPHSPHEYGWRVLFSLYDDALYKERPSEALMFARHLLVKKFHIWVHDWYHALLLTYYIILSITLGVNGFLFLGVVPAILSVISTNMSNYFNHWSGYRSFPTNDGSRNTWWLLPLAFGENWHNNHHYEPGNPLPAQRWWEFDPTGLFVKLLRTDGKTKKPIVVKPGDKHKIADKSWSHASTKMMME